MGVVRGNKRQTDVEWKAALSGEDEDISVRNQGIILQMSEASCLSRAAETSTPGENIFTANNEAKTYRPKPVCLLSSPAGCKRLL